MPSGQNPADSQPDPEETAASPAEDTGNRVEDPAQAPTGTSSGARAATAERGPVVTDQGDLVHGLYREGEPIAEIRAGDVVRFGGALMVSNQPEAYSYPSSNPSWRCRSRVSWSEPVRAVSAMK